MKLSGLQFEQLQVALLDAYTEFGLRQMLRVQMEVDLDQVAGSGHMEQITFDLIRWAEQRGQVARLIDAAYAGNQENPLLAQLAKDAQSWFIALRETPRPLDELSPVAPPAAHQVFLSYSRKDSRQMQTVHRSLTDAGLSVWTDEGLAVGTHSWQDAIRQAIDSAQYMVVLLSPDAHESKWVNTEIGYAQEIERAILPVLLKGNRKTSIPLTLWTVQYEDGRTDLAVATKRLVAALRTPEVRGRRASTWSTEDAAAVRTKKEVDLVPQRRRSPLWLLIAVAIALGLLAIALWWARDNWGQFLLAPAVEPTAETTSPSAPTPTNTASLTPQPIAAGDSTATPTPMPPEFGPVPAVDADGRFNLFGRAAAGSEVEVLIDGVVVAIVTGDEQGRWTYALFIDEPGQHLLAVRGVAGAMRLPGKDDPVWITVAPTSTPTNTPASMLVAIATAPGTTIPIDTSTLTSAPTDMPTLSPTTLATVTNTATSVTVATPDPIPLVSKTNFNDVTAQLVEFSKFQNTLTAIVRFTNVTSETIGLWPTYGSYLLDEKTGEKFQLSEQQKSGKIDIPAYGQIDFWVKFLLADGINSRYLSLLLPNGVHFDNIEVPEKLKHSLITSDQPIGVSATEIHGITAQLIDFSKPQNAVTAVVRFSNATPEEIGLWPTNGSHLLSEVTGEKYRSSEQQNTGKAAIPANDNMEFWIKFHMPDDADLAYLTLLLPNGVHFDHIQLP